MAASYMSNQGNVYAFDQSRGVEIVVACGNSALFFTHTHISTVNILLVRTGRIRFFTDSCERDIEASDAVIIQPHQAHSLQASGQFSILTLSLHCSLFVHRSSSRNNFIEKFLSAMIRFNYLSMTEKRKFIEVVEKVSTADHSYNDPLSLLQTSLEENPEQPVSLDQMAQTVHMEKGHLIRKFKQRYGITPHSFITQNRLRKARRHFIDNHSLTESALMAGFYDQSHFIRNFKKLHNLTPTEYLRASRPMEA